MNPESQEESSSNISDTTESPLTLEEARAKGSLIQDMPPPLTFLLADEHGLYRTTELRHPGNLQEFLTDRNRERALNTIGDRVYENMKEVEEYKDAAEKGELGALLSDTFGAITAIDAYNVHVPQSNIVDEKKEMGTFVAEKMIFTLPTEAASKNLSSVLQVLLRSRKGAPVVHEGVKRVDDSANVEYTVDVKLNEHQIRFLARAVSAVVAMEDKKAHGLTLPLEKLPLADWEEQGETFPPGIRGRMEAANANYRQQLRLSYQGEPIDKDKKENLLGTEAAASLQGMRDIMNIFIHAQRKRYSNDEQDPDLDSRPFIEEGVILKRDPVSEGENRRGPQTSRTLTVGEKAKNQGIRVYKDVRKKPFYTVLEVGKAALSGGAEWVMTGLQHSTGVNASAKQFVDDVVTWRRQTREAISRGERLDGIVEDIKFWTEDKEIDSMPADS